MLALVAGVAASVTLGETLTQQLTARWLENPTWASLAAHAVLFVGPYIAAQAIGLLLHRLGRAVMLGGADRMVGGLFGALAGVVVTGAGLAAAQRVDFVAKWLSGSQLARPLSEMFAVLMDLAQGLGL